MVELKPWLKRKTTYILGAVKKENKTSITCFSLDFPSVTSYLSSVAADARRSKQILQNFSLIVKADSRIDLCSDIVGFSYEYTHMR